MASCGLRKGIIQLDSCIITTSMYMHHQLQNNKDGKYTVQNQDGFLLKC